MSKFSKNSLLDYVSKNFEVEQIVNPERIFRYNENFVKSPYVLYLCEREIKVRDNFAFQFALQKSKDLGLSLKIIHPKINYEYELKQNFINRQIKQVQNIFDKLNIDFAVVDKKPYDIIKNINPSILIVDFNPILKRDYLKNLNCQIYEIDGHNIIPARFVSNKQEYSAATIRRKIYYNIYPFLTEFQNIAPEKTEADFVLEDFIQNKLSDYAELKNNPSKNVVSGLSKYLNLGFISSQRVALEIVKCNASKENKESFLEDMIVRKELADNFCFYAKSFKDFSSVPSWAIKSLNQHKLDIRTHIYSLHEFEEAKTDDDLWNAAQNQLKQEGSIHGYIRMYWAKKILEWTHSPKEALEISIKMNDKYGFDSPSANGYVGILWAIGGLHDRAFADSLVTGKIRRMTYNSMKRKHNLSEYLNKYK